MPEAPAAPLLLKSRRGHPGRRQLWNQPRRRQGVRSAGAEADRLVWNWGSLGFYKPSSAASRVALSGFIHSFCAKFGTANYVPATAEVFMPYRGPEAGIFPKPTLRLRVSAVDDLEGIPGSGQQGRETGRRRMIAPTRQDPEQVTIVGRWAQSHRAVWETVWNTPQKGCARRKQLWLPPPAPVWPSPRPLPGISAPTPHLPAPRAARSHLGATRRAVRGRVAPALYGTDRPRLPLAHKNQT